MKGSETKLVQFMQGADKRFIIPVYQRNYDWRTENCKQLYDDLCKVSKNDRKSHFFGSIVSVHNPDGQFNEHLVIDGQQRLTTVSLLLLAMYNLLEKKIVIPEKASLSERIYEQYLVDKWQDDDTRIKLKPVKNDQNAFVKLFSEEDDHIKESNITVNYEYFYNRIQKEEIKIDQLYDAICKLEIISITLNYEDNPQLIFESLNSTGLALSEGDKIRNFILMGLETKIQNEYYDKYWNKIEVCTSYDVSMFIRDYLSVKQQNTPSMGKVYVIFKQFVEDTGIGNEELLEDLLKYAKRYEVLIKANTTNKALNACISRLNRLETTVTRPFFLEVLRLLSENIIDINQVLEIFITTENYLFRRTICDLPTNMLNKIFVALHREIVRYDNSTDNYVEKFKYAMVAKKEKARFPSDKEFVEEFSNRAVYLMNSKNKIYILERLENNGTAEDKDIYAHCDEGIYSIEHIMPQHLTPGWIADLGTDYLNVHETWLHRIANLTLTAYNSKYSNNSFEEKKAMENGFLESGIRMNTYIARKEKWTEKEIEERNDYLMGKALEIWAMPSTDFKPAIKELESYTLEDDYDFSGRMVSKYVFKSTEQNVSSWIELYERVIKELHIEDRTVLTKVAYNRSEDNELAPYITNDSKVLRSSYEVEAGIFVERNTNTGNKVAVLKKLFKLYGVDLSELTIYLKDENEDDANLAGTRFELRKRYWGYALEYIKEAHGTPGAFCNVNPSKENWISGFFGIGGLNISCVANYDIARVEFVISKSDKERNKEIFDYLFKHKDEIEKSLDCELVWNRSDDTKGSYIYTVLKDVSIENETDWLMMAKFHASYSKKFYDVFVPYVRK